MQAISGALQMAGGIILLLVEGNCIFVPIMRSHCCRSARGGWETDFGLSQMQMLLLLLLLCWTVETVCANVRTERQPLLLLLHSRTAMLRHVQLSLT